MYIFKPVPFVAQAAYESGKWFMKYTHNSPEGSPAVMNIGDIEEGGVYEYYVTDTVFPNFYHCELLIFHWFLFIVFVFLC